MLYTVSSKLVMSKKIRHTPFYVFNILKSKSTNAVVNTKKDQKFSRNNIFINKFYNKGETAS